MSRANSRWQTATFAQNTNYTSNIDTQRRYKCSQNRHDTDRQTARLFVTHSFLWWTRTAQLRPSLRLSDLYVTCNKLFVAVCLTSRRPAHKKSPKSFQTLYAIQRFITVFTTALYWPPPSAWPIHSMQLHLTSPTRILILSKRPRTSLSL